MLVETHVDEALEQCEVCPASDKAPHVPKQGTSSAPRSDENLQEDLLFADDIIASYATAVPTKNSLLIFAHSKNP